MRELTAARNDGDVVARLARDYEMRHLEADIHRLEIAARRLTDRSRDLEEMA